MVITMDNPTSSTCLTNSATRRCPTRPLVPDQIRRYEYNDLGIDISPPYHDHCVDPLCQHTLSLSCSNKDEQISNRVCETTWTVVDHHHLPTWLRDNEFLFKGHRPPLYSFSACFKSMCRIHTETGNIWTHLLGFVAFICIAAWFFVLPGENITWHDKIVFSAFFVGAIVCLGFSWTFHTVLCHSENVHSFFIKLDFCGIAILIMGSFVPWLYYSYYYRAVPRITYLVLIGVLGSICIAVSMLDQFSKPKYRALRAAVFLGLGLSGILPTMHYVITDGFWTAVDEACLDWLGLMALLYIIGAVIYAWRIPERIWPGKFDIWFQSHQILHMFVIVAALVHFHGISTLANKKLSCSDCA